MISAVVQTFNEENNIARCLTSLAFTDEIILVDMGSTDRTVEKALELGVKAYQHPYTGFVEPARNFALSRVRGDWILVVDADEEVPRKLADYLVKLKDGQVEAINYYRLPRKNLVFGKWIKHAGWWPDYQIRFFKKGTVSWIDKLHGVPITMGEGRELSPLPEYALIHHHYESIEQYLERMNRYTSIQAKELYLNNRKFSLEALILTPVNEFVKRFFLYEGYRDGIHGLALSLLQSISETAVILKLWEMSSFRQDPLSLSHYRSIVKKESKIRNYWLYNELLKKKYGFLRDMVLRILRKINSYA